MKRVNNLYKQIISFENVLSANRKARKGKRFKYSAAKFELHLEETGFIKDGVREIMIWDQVNR